MAKKAPYTIKPWEAHDMIELLFDIAFGEDAINKEYDPEEVLDKLREFSDTALESEEDANYSPAMWS